MLLDFFASAEEEFSFLFCNINTDRQYIYDNYFYYFLNEAVYGPLYLLLTCPLIQGFLNPMFL